MNIVSSRQIGQLVRIKRKEKGFTQKQLAQSAEVSERLVSALELGDAPGIQLDKLLKILATVELDLFVSDKKPAQTAAPSNIKRDGKESCVDAITEAFSKALESQKSQSYAEGFAHALDLITNPASNQKENSPFE